MLPTTLEAFKLIINQDTSFSDHNYALYSEKYHHLISSKIDNLLKIDCYTDINVSYLLDESSRKNTEDGDYNFNLESKKSIYSIISLINESNEQIILLFTVNFPSHLVSDLIEDQPKKDSTAFECESEKQSFKEENAEYFSDFLAEGIDPFDYFKFDDNTYEALTSSEEPQTLESSSSSSSEALSKENQFLDIIDQACAEAINYSHCLLTEKGTGNQGINALSNNIRELFLNNNFKNNVRNGEFYKEPLNYNFFIRENSDEIKKLLDKRIKVEYFYNTLNPNFIERTLSSVYKLSYAVRPNREECYPSINAFSPELFGIQSVSALSLSINEMKDLPGPSYRN